MHPNKHWFFLFWCVDIQEINFEGMLQTEIFYWTKYVFEYVFEFQNSNLPQLVTNDLSKFHFSYWLKLHTEFGLESKSCKGFFLQINFPPIRELKFITGNVIFKLRYDQIYPMKTTYVNLFYIFDEPTLLWTLRAISLPLK